jgi:hypothetical protein
MAHTPVDTKTNVDRALPLIEEMKAKLTKMVVEEAKRSALPTALSLSPSLDALHSPSASFPPQCQAIFKRRCLTNVGRRKLVTTIHGYLAGEVSVAMPLLSSMSLSPWAPTPQLKLVVHFSRSNVDSAVDRYAPLLGLTSPSPWMAPPSPAVMHYSCSAVDPAVS